MIEELLNFYVRITVKKNSWSFVRNYRIFKITLVKITKKKVVKVPNFIKKMRIDQNK